MRSFPLVGRVLPSGLNATPRTDLGVAAEDVGRP